MAKKGEKLSEATRKKMSESMIKEKKLCKHCEKMIVNLDQHYMKCRKNPENKKRQNIERTKYRSQPPVKAREQARVSNYNRVYAINPENKKKIHEQAKERYNNNREKINSTRNITRVIKYTNEKNSLIHILGGHICSKCKFNDYRALNIEHIHDTGHLDDKRFHNDDRTRNSYYLKHFLEAIENLQILCSNCNRIKEHERKKGLKKSDKRRNIKNREDYSQLHNLAVEILGGHICNKCKFNDYRALDIEHIDNDGSIDRKKFTRQDEFFNYIIDNPQEARKKLQIMCRNCNEIKKNNVESEIKF